MRIFAAMVGFLSLVSVLADSFNTVVLARRAQHRFRMARGFYRFTWRPVAAIARWIHSGPRRETFLGIYGPLSLLMLIALWAAALIFAFALLQWAAGLVPADGSTGFGNDVYLSATTFFTLSTGDPQNDLSKSLAAIEGGLGFGFLALVIGYLPVLYESFSQRELRVSLLDARAGSPPAAAEFVRCGDSCNPGKLEQEFEHWEEWTGEVMENQISYPMLAYFRSHHPDQSWLTAMVAVLDSAALTILCASDGLKDQAALTFAIGRHAINDIAGVFSSGPLTVKKDRLPHDAFVELSRKLRDRQTPLNVGLLTEHDLNRLRSLYEPQAEALADYLLMALPPWIADESRRIDWLAAAVHPPVPTAVSDPYRRVPRFRRIYERKPQHS